MPSSITLDYDTLPAGSRLRREVSADGTITISLGGRELTDADRSRAMRQSAAVSALLCAVLCTVIAMTVFLVIGENRRLLALPHSLLIVLMIAVGVFVVALFLLVWRRRSGELIDRWQRVATQTTVISIRGGDVFIESIDPRGSISDRMTPALIHVTHVTGGTGFAVELLDAKHFPRQVFEGVTHAEAAWIARTIRGQMRA